MTQYTIDDLLHLMTCLRHPTHGCPWDLAQDLKDIVPFTLEEAYEVADAIEQDDLQALPGELGDLLFQTVFYAQIAKDRDLFCFEDVVHQVTAKLVSRHPHVFPDGTLQSFGQADGQSVDAVKAHWEHTKAKERASRGQFGLFDDVPRALPATTRAHKIQKRAARLGFDWSDAQGVLNKLSEESEELQDAMMGSDPAAVREEFGDLLFTMMSLGRHLGIDSEQALRDATRKFESRMRHVVAMAETETITLPEASHTVKERLWDRAKTR
jgi:ATP diphosphatase